MLKLVSHLQPSSSLNIMTNNWLSILSIIQIFLASMLLFQIYFFTLLSFVIIPHEFLSLPSFPACGAKTPLSKATTLCVVLIALSTLTQTFNYIPQVTRWNNFLLNRWNIDILHRYLLHPLLHQYSLAYFLASSPACMHASLPHSFLSAFFAFAPLSFLVCFCSCVPLFILHSSILSGCSSSCYHDVYQWPRQFLGYLGSIQTQ